MRSFKYALLALAFATGAANAEVYNPPTANQAGNGIAVSSPTGNSTISTQVTPNVQSGMTYPTVATDGGKFVTFTNAGAVAVSLSAATTTGFGSGFAPDYYVEGTGPATITATTSTFPNGLNALICNKGQDCFTPSNGTNYDAAMSLPLVPTDNLLGNPTAATNYPVSMALPSCSGAANALTYNASTHAFGCNSISGSGTITSSTAGQMTWFAATGTTVVGNANVTYASGLLTIGVASAQAGTVALSGATSGATTLAGPASGGGTMTFPAGSDTVVTLGATQTLTGKTLTTPVLSAPTFTGNITGTTTAGVAIGPSGRLGFNGRGGWVAGADGLATWQNNAGTSSLTPVSITGAPTPTGTGSPTMLTGSQDSDGGVTAGATATSVIITSQESTLTNVPFCEVVSQTQLVAFAYTVVITSGHYVISITQTATTGNIINYHCTLRG